METNIKIGKCCFAGHRRCLARDIEARLTCAIQAEIDNGCRSFIMGTHGKFDDLALTICKSFRKKYEDIDIEVVITSLNQVKTFCEYDDKFGKEFYTPYQDVSTLMYEIEETHFKRRITLSNEMMINDCDRIICYVNTQEYRSGAKNTLRYAEKRGLKITNLFRDEDRPFYGMSKEEIKEYIRQMMTI